MPRRRVARPEASRPLGIATTQTVESRADGEWHVRRLSGAGSHKSYTCPGCHRAVTPGTAHVVVWPVERPLLSSDALDERRHWHGACWDRRR